MHPMVKRAAAVVLAVAVGGAALWSAAREPLFRALVAEVDRDGDGVARYLEDWFDTSDGCADTDGDGVADYAEIFELTSDPLIADGDMDDDGDGLSNAEETALGTAPSKRDTDGDGLADDEERRLATDPVAVDTDADGVRDGYEVQLGTDPRMPQAQFAVSAQSQDVCVRATLGGHEAETLAVKPTVYDRLFTEDIAGRMSDAYDVSAQGALAEGTISFSLATDCVTPTVYYFREATQTLEPLVTVIEDGVATASVTEKGTYILLDRTVYESSFVWEDRWGASAVYAGLEVVLVIDDSASMQNTDPLDERLNVTRELIDRLPAGARIGVVRFATDVTTLTPMLTSDREAAKANLTKEMFTANGQTYMYTAMQTAMTLFDTAHDATQKVIIVLSDGQPTDRALREETIAAVEAQELQVYTVAFGTEYEKAHAVMQSFAEAVNGTHFTAQTADELTVVYDAIAKFVDITTDTDGDGIPDYYEDHAMSFGGVSIPLDKTKADTDGDGVPDGDEVKVELVYSEDGTQVYVKGVLLSDPTMGDTDGDGIPDDEDDLPYDNTYTATMTTEYSTSSLVLEMDYSWFFDDNTVYNPLLSETSAVFSTMAYEPSAIRICDARMETSTQIDQLTELLAYFGMQDPQSYQLSTDYNDVHISEAAVGYRTVQHDGALRTVLAVVVRGTNSTLEEWSSNFDIGDLLRDTEQDDWVNTDHHKGFDVAATRIARFVERYIAQHGLYRDQLVYWVTGHSRGAGIANILGANLERDGKTAFTYTFASPNTTLAADAAEYRTIFNIINEDDFVPYLPASEWGYVRYGISTDHVSVREQYETRWETFTGIWDYNSDTNLSESAVAVAGILAKGVDPRIDCYRYTCACHGDGTDNNVTIKNAGMSQSSRENAIAKIPSNALAGCIITRYDGGLFSGWDFEVCQTPFYFMQVLAAYMGGEIDAIRFAVDLKVGDRYSNAKSALVEIGISGVEHPHYPETYCMLAGVLGKEAFNR